MDNILDIEPRCNNIFIYLSIEHHGKLGMRHTKFKIIDQHMSVICHMLSLE
jgi:hypothetical protein